MLKWTKIQDSEQMSGAGKQRAAAPHPPLSAADNAHSKELAHYGKELAHNSKELAHNSKELPHNSSRTYLADVTEEVNMNQAGELVTLDVTLPSGWRMDISVDYNTPMLDLLVSLAAKSKLNPTGLALILVSEDTGKALSYKPNQSIGALGGRVVRIVNKDVVSGRSAGRDSKHEKPFEVTHRFTVNFPRGQKTVVRVNPLMKLAELLTTVCRDKGLDLDLSKYVLQIPGNPGMPVDLGASIQQVGVYEMNLVTVAVATSRNHAASMHDLSRPTLLSDQSLPVILVAGDHKKKKGLLSFLGKKDKKHKPSVQSVQHIMMPVSSTSVHSSIPHLHLQTTSPVPQKQENHQENELKRPQSALVPPLTSRENNHFQQQHPQPMLVPALKKRRAPSPPAPTNVQTVVSAPTPPTNVQTVVSAPTPPTNLQTFVSAPTPPTNPQTVVSAPTPPTNLQTVSAPTPPTNPQIVVSAHTPLTNPQTVVSAPIPPTNPQTFVSLPTSLLSINTHSGDHVKTSSTGNVQICGQENTSTVHNKRIVLTRQTASDLEEVSASAAAPEQQVSPADMLSCIHSRHSSASSGYHELTLSGCESPEATQGSHTKYKTSIDTTSIDSSDNANGDSAILESPVQVSPIVELPEKSDVDLLSGLPVISIGSLPARKTRKAPAPPSVQTSSAQVPAESLAPVMRDARRSATAPALPTESVAQTGHARKNSHISLESVDMVEGISLDFQHAIQLGEEAFSLCSRDMEASFGYKSEMAMFVERMRKLAIEKAEEAKHEPLDDSGSSSSVPWSDSNYDSESVIRHHHLDYNSEAGSLIRREGGWLQAVHLQPNLDGCNEGVSEQAVEQLVVCEEIVEPVAMLCPPPEFVDWDDTSTDERPDRRTNERTDSSIDERTHKQVNENIFTEIVQENCNPLDIISTEYVAATAIKEKQTSKVSGTSVNSDMFMDNKVKDSGTLYNNDTFVDNKVNDSGTLVNSDTSTDHTLMSHETLVNVDTLTDPTGPPTSMFAPSNNSHPKLVEIQAHTTPARKEEIILTTEDLSNVSFLPPKSKRAKPIHIQPYVQTQPYVWSSSASLIMAKACHLPADNDIRTNMSATEDVKSRCSSRLLLSQGPETAVNEQSQTARDLPLTQAFMHASSILTDSVDDISDDPLISKSRPRLLMNSCNTPSRKSTSDQLQVDSNNKKANRHSGSYQTGEISNIVTKEIDHQTGKSIVAPQQSNTQKVSLTDVAASTNAAGADRVNDQTSRSSDDKISVELRSKKHYINSTRSGSASVPTYEGLSSAPATDQMRRKSAVGKQRPKSTPKPQLNPHEQLMAAVRMFSRDTMKSVAIPKFYKQ